MVLTPTANKGRWGRPMTHLPVAHSWSFAKWLASDVVSFWVARSPAKSAIPMEQGRMDTCLGFSPFNSLSGCCFLHPPLPSLQSAALSTVWGVTTLWHTSASLPLLFQLSSRRLLPCQTAGHVCVCGRGGGLCQAGRPEESRVPSPDSDWAHSSLCDFHPVTPSLWDRRECVHFRPKKEKKK